MRAIGHEWHLFACRLADYVALDSTIIMAGIYQSMNIIESTVKFANLTTIERMLFISNIVWMANLMGRTL